MSYNDISIPTIIRLTKKAGIKNISEECFETIRCIIINKMRDIITTSLIINSEHQTKTLMSNDIYESFFILGENVTRSNNLCKDSKIK